MRGVAACRPYRTAMLYRLVQHVYFTRESNPSYRAAFSDAVTEDTSWDHWETHTHKGGPAF